MTFSTDKPIRDVAADIHALYRRPWWKVWQPKITEADAYNAITAALVGNPEPISRYGIGVSPATPRMQRLDTIREQVAKLRARP